MERTETTVVARPEVANQISFIPSPREPQPSEHAHVAPSLVPVALVAGGYATVVAAVTTLLCVVGA
ncbi:MAG: hypothetical protein FWF02_04255 [Micrococcales bacterium]|nr:hypothetical protein [Micrococcales bacterium]MCL2666904.1 hypothetical protein [Micrococcales bacterium]